MSTVEQPSRGGLIARVQGILLRPGPEWDIIAGELSTVRGLFTGYACILAAIAPVALVLQSMLFLHWTLPLVIGWAAITYIGALLGVFILGIVIDALATSFDGQKNRDQAMKLAVYSYTAVWVAGILNIVPALGILALLAGLYGLYILYLGLPKLMRAPQDKAIGYFAVSVIVAIVINAVISAVIGAVVVSMTAGAIIGGASPFARAANENANLARIEAASAQMSSAVAHAQATTAAQAAGGKATSAVDPEQLKALLPATIAGMARTEVSAQSAGAGDVGGSDAEATYVQGAARITLNITDMAAMGAFAGMAGAMNIASSKETATGYEKVGKIDGRMTTEEWDRGNKSGKYGVMVADRFMISAEGSGTSMDVLKSAVAAVEQGRLEAIAKS